MNAALLLPSTLSQTTLSEPVLQILKYCLLGVLYLFLARVLRAVWVELRSDRIDRHDVAAAPSRGVRGPSASGPSGAPTSGRRGRASRRAKSKGLAGVTVFKIVEPPEHRGTTYRIESDEVTVGRAGGCAISVPDTFASQIHARLFRRDGELFVEDLGATNGTWLNRKRVHGPLRIHPGDRLQVGNTVLELQR